jgi:hypothetical protein
VVRNQSGFVKYVVMILILFGAYSGYKLLGISFASARMERAVQSALEEIDHKMSDDGIRMRIVRSASVSSLEVQKEEIAIDREKRHGERVINVRLDYPVTVSYLGADRTFHTDVDVTRVIPVDEAAEALREQRMRAQEADQQRKMDIAAEHVGRLKDALSECEAKHGKGNCRVSEGFGGRPGEIQKWY